MSYLMLLPVFLFVFQHGDSDLITIKSINLSSVSWDGSCFVVVGDYGVILKSQNGIDWKNYTSRLSVSSLPMSLNCREGLCVGLTNNGMVFEINSENSSSISTYKSQFDNWSSIALNKNGVLIIVGKPGGYLVDPKLGYFETIISDLQGYSLEKISFNNGTFFCFSDNDDVLTSQDGTSWARLGEKLNFVAECGTNFNGKFIFGGKIGLSCQDPETKKFSNVRFLSNGETIDRVRAIESNGNIVVASCASGLITSSDGVLWILQKSAPFFKINDIAWSGKLFVGVGSNKAILISHDGIDWDKVELKLGTFLEIQ